MTRSIRRGPVGSHVNSLMVRASRPSALAIASIRPRPMTVIGRGRMVEIATSLALDARTMSEFTWDPTGPRRIDRVMRRFKRR